MASFVCTIGMNVERFSTLVAMRNNIIANTLCPTVVKYKVLSQILVFKILGFYLSGIFYNTSFQLVNIFKSFMFEVSTRLFATNAASTIHHQVFIFLMIF